MVRFLLSAHDFPPRVCFHHSARCMHCPPATYGHSYQSFFCLSSSLLRTYKKDLIASSPLIKKEISRKVTTVSLSHSDSFSRFLRTSSPRSAEQPCAGTCFSDPRGQPRRLAARRGLLKHPKAQSADRSHPEAVYTRAGTSLPPGAAAHPRSAPPALTVVQRAVDGGAERPVAAVRLALVAHQALLLGAVGPEGEVEGVHQEHPAHRLLAGGPRVQLVQRLPSRQAERLLRRFIEQRLGHLSRPLLVHRHISAAARDEPGGLQRGREHLHAAASRG